MIRLFIIIVITLFFIPSPVQAQNFSRWVFSDNTDPFTDEMQLSLGSEAIGSIRGEVVAIVCTDEYVALAFNDGGFNVDRTNEVQIRIDDNPSWSFVGEHMRGGSYTTFDQVTVQRLVHGLRDGQRVLLYRAGSNTVRVPLNGSTTAAQDFIARCPHLE
ncbi:hypothetical protein [Hyphobacterium marinum]|uniref:Uncharacterized protein n=1 Tax=Hyphobacterium marinum TaxID=3116574 RepID=A0ABU7M0A1_9PROT|nr:hypothetical protein [Hyphobacterium sp. Y6023]MEE2567218.1 hypothetical protein [Hyphobacterium sp. Y6023]